jgi:hypothetical protein
LDVFVFEKSNDADNITKRFFSTCILPLNKHVVDKMLVPSEVFQDPHKEGGAKQTDMVKKAAMLWGTIVISYITVKVMKYKVAFARLTALDPYWTKLILQQNSPLN